MEIVKTYRQSIPATRFIGKKYGDEDRVNGGFGQQWGEWFQNGWFDVLEEAAGGADAYWASFARDSGNAAVAESKLPISLERTEILLNGQAAKNYASQGQTRTAALSIKLAEREIHFENFGEYPVLLLDDVLSELDAGRQNFILNRIMGGQIFITCCEGRAIAEKTGGKVLCIEKGAIS